MSTATDPGFADRLLAAIDDKQSYVVVGLDPDIGKMPNLFRGGAKDGQAPSTDVGSAIVSFNQCIIDVVAPHVPAVKPQIAFYEQYGLTGIHAFIETVAYAKKQGLLVIEDGKRNDIGNTAQAYAAGHLGRVMVAGRSEPVFDVDAITINPYLGADGVMPFLDTLRQYGKGVFVLVKTSNRSSAEIQDLRLADGKTLLFEHVGKLVDGWSRDHLGRRGYSSVGAVVGGTFPAHAKTLRRIMPQCVFLVPGYGAQGATAEDVLDCFGADGYGAVIAASRSINYPHGAANDIGREEFEDLVLNSVTKMKTEINQELSNLRRLPWG